VTALLELGAGIGWTDAEAANAAREHVDGRSGRLGELFEWLCATQGHFPARPLRRPRCLLLAPASDAVLARAADLGVGVRELDISAGLSAGTGVADEEIDAGADLLVVAGGDDTAASATLVGLLTGAEPVALLPRGVEAIDASAWIRRAAELRDTRNRLAALRTRPDALLAAAGNPAIGAAAGLILQAAARRTAVVLDGLAPLAAALLCLDIQSRASQWWQVADTSGDRAHRRAVEKLELRPLLDLGTRTGDGAAGLLAVAVLQTAAGA
jgi:nicotinate-nucleotide--dimethylbenzimidazole phosphoribosyltransferase